jgi:hypothetical protein
MPEKWSGDDHAKLRTQCLVPEDLEFATKNVILSRMINKLWDSKRFKGKYVGIDSSFGRDSKFLESLPKDLVYFADIPCNHLVFLEEPVMEVPEYSGRGKRAFVTRPSIDPVTVASIGKNNEIPWEDVVLGTGSKGPIVARDKCIKVFDSYNGLPTQQVWLYIREKEDGSLKYALCNESLNASKNAIRKPALMRWSIEQCFKECKTYIGMDHYETRSWIGWRRQILFSLIALLFYLKLQHEWTTQEDYPLETPIVRTAVTLNEFLDAVARYLNGEPINNLSIQDIAKANQRFITLGIIKDVNNKYLVKTGEVLKAVENKIKNNADSFNSHSRTKVKKLFKLAATTETD